MDIKHFYVTDQVERGLITIEYCPNDQMVADYATKALQGKSFGNQQSFIMNLPQVEQAYVKAVSHMMRARPPSPPSSEESEDQGPTAIDLRKGYYNIQLDEESSNLCTTVFPWGKYRYKKLPMGISVSPDIFQKAMNDVVGDLDYVLVYLDDILILSNQDDSFEDHLAKIQEVFKRLHNVGLKVNLHKHQKIDSLF